MNSSFMWSYSSLFGYFFQFKLTDFVNSTQLLN